MTRRSDFAQLPPATLRLAILEEEVRALRRRLQAYEAVFGLLPGEADGQNPTLSPSAFKKAQPAK